MSAKYFRLLVLIGVMVLMVLWFYVTGKYYPLNSPRLRLRSARYPHTPNIVEPTLPPTEIEDFELPGNLPLPKVPDSQKDRQERIRRVCQRFRKELYRPHYRASKSNFFPENPEKHRHCSTEMCPMLVDLEHKVFFCFIPKVASSTVKTMFLEAKRHHYHPNETSNNVSALHVSANEQLRRVGPLFFKLRELRKFYKMMVVRHPFERLISVYKDKVDKPRSEIEYFYKKYWDKYLAKLNRTMLTFANFVDFLLETKVEDYDPHWAPYYSRCEPCIVDYDFIGKLDDDSKANKKKTEKSMSDFDGLSVLRQRLGLTNASSIVNKSQTKRRLKRETVSLHNAETLLRKMPASFTTLNTDLAINATFSSASNKTAKNVTIVGRNRREVKSNVIDADFDDFDDSSKIETKGELSPNAIKTEQLNELTMEEYFIQLDRNKVMQLYKKYRYDFELFGYHIVNYIDIFENR